MKLVAVLAALSVSPSAAYNNTCGGHEAQKGLKWNVTSAGAAVQMPFGPLPQGESFADAICCDSFFTEYAEPSGFFQQPDVALFDRLDPSKPTTFYDSVCGIPLFIAPQNRTFDQFKQESFVSVQHVELLVHVSLFALHQLICDQFCCLLMILISRNMAGRVSEMPRWFLVLSPTTK